MKRASQEPRVVNALMQGDTHATRGMGACGDQHRADGRDAEGGKASTIRSERGGALKTMVRRAAAYKSRSLLRGSTSARYSCTTRNDNCIRARGCTRVRTTAAHVT